MIWVDKDIYTRQRKLYAYNGDKMNVIKDGKNIIICNCDCFDVSLSLDCGQAFRWSCDESGIWSGVAAGKLLRLSQNNDRIILFDTTEADYEKIWRIYFDLDRDYNKILESYTEKNLLEACRKYRGIHILKQDEWETICSFIISANNNIPRIKGIIGRLCESYGEKLYDGCYTFPSAQRVASLDISELDVLRAGFRSKYILDAAKKISTGEVDLEKMKSLPFNDAKQELLKIKGVGEKVAQCALLYGFGRTEAFPIDVWVKRIISELYPDGLPECIKNTEGIAQQYLFHWRRNLEKENNK